MSALYIGFSMGVASVISYNYGIVFGSSLVRVFSEKGTSFMKLPEKQRPGENRSVSMRTGTGCAVIEFLAAAVAFFRNSGGYRA